MSFPCICNMLAFIKILSMSLTRILMQDHTTLSLNLFFVSIKIILAIWLIIFVNICRVSKMIESLWTWIHIGWINLQCILKSFNFGLKLAFLKIKKIYVYLIWYCFASAYCCFLLCIKTTLKDPFFKIVSIWKELWTM